MAAQHQHHRHRPAWLIRSGPDHQGRASAVTKKLRRRRSRGDDDDDGVTAVLLL